MDENEFWSDFEPTTKITYEMAMARLEDIITQMENGNIDVDKLTIRLEEANTLLKICQNKLKSVEDEIKEITK